MVYWLSSPDQLDAASIDDIFQANLELYNVITMFLTSDEMSCLFSMISEDKAAFMDRWHKLGADHPASLHYYIAGPVAAGKSSLLEHLRCFDTFEEWTRPPPEEMFRSFDSLDDAEMIIVDDFIYSELREKNELMNSAGPGIHFMDRAPLDLYAFSKTPSEVRDKTAQLKIRITNSRPFQPGEIVLLTADSATLVRRNFQRGRRPDESGGGDYLAKQRDILKAVYSENFEIDTSKVLPSEVARSAARHALLGSYVPVDFRQIMARYET